MNVPINVIGSTYEISSWNTIPTKTEPHRIIIPIIFSLIKYGGKDQMELMMLLYTGSAVSSLILNMAWLIHMSRILIHRTFTITIGSMS